MPAKSSAEARALAIAASNAAISQPQDALALSASLSGRADVSAEDRAAAAASTQEALKRLSEAAARGDAQAQSAIDQYRANK